MGKGQTHQGDVNPDLVKERLDCPFDQEEVTNLLDGSREKTEKRRSLEKFILSAKVNKKLSLAFASFIMEKEKNITFNNYLGSGGQRDGAGIPKRRGAV